MPQPSNNKTNLLVCPLASGSKGNATFISDKSTSILIDAGLSGIEIERRLKSKSLVPKDLDAIVVSHEHSDHIRGAGILSRRFNVPVYITSKTQKAAGTKLGKVDDFRYFECGKSFQINTLNIHPFSISHDAADPAGFTIKHNKIKVGIATDLGIATAMVKQHLKKCSLVILEANHDPAMLMSGPYPWHLKQRVKSRTGHLSNYDSKELLQEICHKNLCHVILGHLSEENNTPEKALSTAGLGLNGYRPSLCIAAQDQCGELFCLQ